MTPTFKPGDKVLVFGEHPGVIKKLATKEFYLIAWATKTTKYLCHIRIEDVVKA